MGMKRLVAKCRHGIDNPYATLGAMPCGYCTVGWPRQITLAKQPAGPHQTSSSGSRFGLSCLCPCTLPLIFCTWRSSLSTIMSIAAYRFSA